eukprot:1181609-Prorocentrum_minimum.AAC.6
MRVCSCVFVCVCVRVRARSHVCDGERALEVWLARTHRHPAVGALSGAADHLRRVVLHVAHLLPRACRRIRRRKRRYIPTADQSDA